MARPNRARTATNKGDTTMTEDTMAIACLAYIYGLIGGALFLYVNLKFFGRL